MRKIVFLLVVVFQATYYSQTDNFIRGADLSFNQQIEDLGGKYTVNSDAKEALDIFKDNGANYVRLRLWYAPSDGYCGLAKTIEYAKRLKAKGFKFLLDFHYSDSWADPGKQNKPAAWETLPNSVLKDSIWAYSKFVINALKSQNVLPDMVQIGNEITQGMLWSDGMVNGSSGWSSLGDLLKFAISGVKSAAGTSTIKIMLHIDNGGHHGTSLWWFNNIVKQNVPFDVIGLSYYPFGDNPLDSLKNNVNDLATRYGKEIIIAETAYPWTLGWNDNTNNSVGSTNQLLTGYPATVQGQQDYMNALIAIIKNIPNSKGTGFFYWAPDWITVNGLGSSWENMTFFNFSGEVLSSISVFNSGANNISTDKLPSSFALNQNYPNPFNPGTIISYQLQYSSNVQIKVYDLLGREICSLVNEYKPAGSYTVKFNAGNLPSGMYLYRISAGTFSQTRKMLLVK